MIDAPALPAACPWCGGSMHIIPTPPDYPSLRLLYRPQCARCGASLGGFSTEHHARCAWNLRADTPDLAALREERNKMKEVLGQVRDAIAHADPDFLKCTPWMTGACSETVVDFISTVLKETTNERD